ncbi:unnamed protein product [Orchesella dallaii]|uniref:Uncharacterized protein n=1 Tax=Orchesella dallaii TaxID=48710 RepID=A0ABP1R0N5_9HEXA
MSGSNGNTKMEKESHPQKSEKDLVVELEKLIRRCEKLESRIEQSPESPNVASMGNILLDEEVSALLEHRKELHKQLEELLPQTIVALKDVKEEEIQNRRGFLHEETQ